MNVFNKLFSIDMILCVASGIFVITLPQVGLFSLKMAPGAVIERLLFL